MNKENKNKKYDLVLAGFTWFSLLPFIWLVVGVLTMMLSSASVELAAVVGVIGIIITAIYPAILMLRGLIMLLKDIGDSE